jgi:hypothetical protein
MPNCPNCAREIEGGTKFCPECGQDLAVVVPQGQRIPTEDVPVPPPPSGPQRGGDENQGLWDRAMLPASQAPHPATYLLENSDVFLNSLRRFQHT